MQDVQVQESASLSPQAPAPPQGVMFFLFFLFGCIGSNLLLPIHFVGKSCMQLVKFVLECVYNFIDVVGFLIRPITIELTEASDNETKGDPGSRVGRYSSGRYQQRRNVWRDNKRNTRHRHRSSYHGMDRRRRSRQGRKVCCTGKSNKKAHNRLCPGRRGWAISIKCRRTTKLDEIRSQRERRQRQDASDTSSKSQADRVMEFSRQVVAPYLTQQLGSDVHFEWEEEFSGVRCEWDPQPVYDPWSSTNDTQDMSTFGTVEISGLDNSGVIEYSVEESSSNKSSFRSHVRAHSGMSCGMMPFVLGVVLCFASPAEAVNPDLLSPEGLVVSASVCGAMAAGSLYKQSSSSKKRKKKQSSKKQPGKTTKKKKTKIIPGHVQVLEQEDLDSMQEGRWLTDNALKAGLHEFVPLLDEDLFNDGVNQSFVDSDAFSTMFMEDYSRGRLLLTLGLPDDTLSQGDDIKHRCFVPISNGIAQVGADRGTHWSLLVFDIKRENGDNLEIRGIHFNSLKPKRSKRSKRPKQNSQQVTVEMINGRMRSLLGKSVHLHLTEAEGVPQQTGGYSCGDYVIFFAETLAVLPFMSSLVELTDVSPWLITREERYLVLSCFTSISKLLYIDFNNNCKSIRASPALSIILSPPFAIQ